MKFAQEPLAWMLPEAEAALFDGLAEEARRGRAIEMNTAAYEALEAAGCLRMFTMRLDSGELVGFMCFVVAAVMHEASLIEANHDSLYVDKRYRGRPVFKFFEWIDGELEAEGVNRISRAVGDVDYSSLLLAQGYERSAVVYTKEF